jgi:hypothetical protein
MSASIATLVWQVACKEQVLDKVQDEIHQVRHRSPPASYAEAQRTACALTIACDMPCSSPNA